MIHLCEREKKKTQYRTKLGDQVKFLTDMCPDWYGDVFAVSQDCQRQRVFLNGVIFNTEMCSF